MDGTPYRDLEAGELLRELREELGLSRAALPHAMLRAKIPRDNIPSVKTLYNVEERGVVPRVRIKFGLAQFYERRLGDIWSPRVRSRTRVAA